MQIKTQPPNQCRPVGTGSKPQSLGPQPGQQERVNRRAQQRDVLNRGQLRPRYGLERPVLLLLDCETALGQCLGFGSRGAGTFIDPAGQYRQIPGREPLGTRRHFARRHASVQPAGRMLAGNNRRTGFSTLEQEAGQPSIEPPLLLTRLAVALPAVSLENRADLGLEPCSALLGGRCRLPPHGCGEHTEV